YVALATVAQQVHEKRIRIDDVTVTEAQERFKKAIAEGLLKVMSKMGISTLDSYTGAQIFEAVGLSHALIDACFTGTPSSVSGSGYPEVAKIALAWHAEAFEPKFSKLGMYGFYKPRKAGEIHDFTPESARQVQKAAILGASGDAED